MSQTVSDAYLMGITEGRSYLKRFAPTLDDARELLANIKATIAVGQSREVAEMLRGERDFWRNQIAKGKLSP